MSTVAASLCSTAGAMEQPFQQQESAPMTEPSEVKRDPVEHALPASAPIVVRNRTEKERKDSGAPNLADLKDPIARNANLPADALVTDAKGTTREGSTECGWLCPCHRSQYDTVSRVRKEPSPENMPVPVFQFISGTKICMG
ncbi:hypothetical protein [Mesorhizobium sp.]|uniref:hypothetical protein n=1 Tax=Mesorhizobium sp. TaxID=1871066 RepID=UPI0025C6493A|nr:hypothetical protein [Mesorhizobium sp.]